MVNQRLTISMPTARAACPWVPGWVLSSNALKACTLHNKAQEANAKGSPLNWNQVIRKHRMQIMFQI